MSSFYTKEELKSVGFKYVGETVRKPDHTGIV